jgi:hypothetical protein
MKKLRHFKTKIKFYMRVLSILSEHQCKDCPYRIAVKINEIKKEDKKCTSQDSATQQDLC